MIASLSGTVLLLEDDAAVIETNGIGFRVLMPKGTLGGLRQGHNITCHTHMIVNQASGEITLVGFERRDELAMFRLLLNVPGIGPKAALALVDSLSIDVINSAIINEQPEVFTRVHGIGAKTARRILFDLKDKVAGLGISVVSGPSEDMELVEALTALGYSVVEAQSAVQSIGPDGTFEDKLRQALAYFAR